MRSSSRWAPIVVVFLAAAGFIAGCVDENALIGPPGSARLNVAPRFVDTGAAQSDPITHIRLAARDAADGSVIGELDVDVDPDDPQWELLLPVDIGDEPVQAQVTVEMLSAQGIVEFSGRIELEISKDAVPEVVPVPVLRGPLDNLDITGVTISTPDTVLDEGQVIGLDATVQGGGPGATVFWSSLDETRATVDETGSVTALLPVDSVLIVAEAGAHADTFRLGIRALPVAVAFEPDSLVFAGIEQTLTMRAFVVDARGDSIPNSPLGIVVANPSIVQYLGGSLYVAVSVGSTTVTATSGASPTLFATATLRVGSGGGPVGSCAGTGTAHSGSITSSQTWTRASGPHRLTGAVTVDSSALLTIEAGAVVCGASSSALYFQNGGYLRALGTAADPVLFESSDTLNPWYGLYFGGIPVDTSRLVHARFQHVSNAIYGDGNHPVVVQDAYVRAFTNYAIYLYAAGARLERTMIEQGGYPSNWAVYTGNDARVQDLVLRDTDGDGLYVGGNNNTLTNVLIQDVAGNGINLGGVQTVIDGLRIEDAGGVGWTGLAIERVASASGVRIVGSGSYGFYGSIGDLALLAPEPADYDSLLGNGNDTLVVYGGSLSHDTAWVRPDVDWLITTTTYIDTTGVFAVMPGARVTFGSSGRLYASDGGALDARGTAAQPIDMVAQDTALNWDGIYLYGAGTSWLHHVRISHVDAYPAVAAGGGMVLDMDSVHIRQSRYTAVGLYSAGSALRNSVIDTTRTAGYAAVELSGAVTWQNNVVRGSAGTGLNLSGSGITLDGGRIEGSASYGIESFAASDSIVAPSTPRIVGNAYPGRMPIQMWASIVPGAAAIDSVLGNARDTAVIYGGTLRNFTMVAGPALPPRVEQFIFIESGARIVVQPGMTIPFHLNGGITARNGGWVEMLGTAAEPIHLVPTDTTVGWGGITLQGTPGDTSWIRHTVIERAVGGSGAIGSYDAHVVVIDSSRVRQSDYYAIYLNSPGAVFHASTIDTTRQSGYPAAVVGNGAAWVNSTLRGAPGIGLRTFSPASYLGGGRIENSGGIGIEMSARPVAGAPIRITGSGSYPGEFDLGAFAVLYPTVADQDSLLGNARDTVVIEGGSSNADTLEIGPAIPWRITSWTYMATNSRLNLMPGAVLLGDVNSQLYVQSGSTLHALGTAAQPITFTSSDPAARWYGLLLQNTPADTSRLRHVLVENTSHSGGAIAVTSGHTVVIDSTRVRNSLYGGVVVASNGSVLRDVVVDTTLTLGYPGISLTGTSILISRGAIRGAADIGLNVSGSIARASVTPRISGSARYPISAPIDALHALFDAATDQDSVVGNVIDTLNVNGGTLDGDTLLVTGALPWRLATWTYFTNNSRLDLQPGATIAGTNSSQLIVQNSTVHAIGTLAQPVRFTSTDPAGRWYGISLQGTPADVSRLHHAVVENAQDLNGAISTSGTHVVVIDSTRVRNSLIRAIQLNTPGSVLHEVTVDTAGDATFAAVQLSGGTTIEGGTIRGARGIGLLATGVVGATSRTPRIVGSGSYPLRTQLANLPILLPTRADHDSLLGNAADTIALINGGIVNSGTFVVASTLPWRLEGALYFDSTAVLQPEPGATLASTTGGQIVLRNGGTLFAVGTETDSIRFTTTDPADRWNGLQFTNAPLAPSRLVHVLIENARDLNGGIYAANTHVVQIDSSRIRNSQYRAVWLNSPNSYIARSTIDTTATVGYPAVSMGAYTLFDNTTIRGAADVGLELTGDSVSLNGGLVTGSQIGLAAATPFIDVIAPEVLPTITGNTGYPARLAPMQLHALAPTSADRALWLGNARDTLLVPSGGPYVTTARVRVTANLPWRVTGTGDMNFSGAGIGLDVDAGSFIRSANAVDWYFRGGATLHALGTAAAPIVFTGEDTTIAQRDNLWWGGLYMQDAPAGDTTRLRHVVIEYGRMPEGEIYASGAHVVLADSVHVRHANERAVQLLTAGSRFNYSTVDTTYDGSAVGGLLPAVTLAANTSMIGSRVVGATGTGVQILGNFVILNTCEVNGSTADGISVSASVTTGVSINNCNIVNGGNVAGSDYAIEYNLTGPAINATNNWWGSPSGPPGSNVDGVFGNVTTTPFLTNVVSIPAWEAP